MNAHLGPTDPVEGDRRLLPPRMPLVLVILAFAGATSALAGGYWDDAWHTERGRDSFLIAPHIAIYAGIALAGWALSLWALLVTRAQGLPAVWRHPPLAAGLLAVAVTLVSGPLDNAWHVAFGRDAVIWSPPHMLGIAGTLALAAALLAELTVRPERWTAPLAIGAGALMLAAAGFSVAEYDTDVPQFDEAFFLPVLGFAAGIALLLIRTAATSRWAATLSAAVYTGFILATGGFLWLVDFPPPALPLLVLPGAVVDLSARHRWSAASSAALYTAALHASYVPVRNLLGEGVRFDAADVALSLALTFVGALVLWLIAGSRAPSPVRASVATTIALFGIGALAPPALAHDPGQGESAGTVALEIRVDRQEVAYLSAVLPAAHCASTLPRAVIARRAGEVIRGPLTKRGCRLGGSVPLEADGRWFVYAEMRRAGDRIESWLPIAVGYGPRRVSDPARYAYIPPERSDTPVKYIGGGLLYAGMLAMLFVTFRLLRKGAALAPTHRIAYPPPSSMGRDQAAATEANEKIGDGHTQAS